MNCPFCGETIKEGAKKCRHCGKWLSDKEEISEMAANSHKNEGLSGWLVLIGLGLIVSPIKILYYLYDLFIGQINDGTFAFASAMIESYKSVYIFEIIGNVFFLLFSIYMIYLFFNRRKNFKPLFLIFVISNFIFLLVDDIWANSVLKQLGEPIEHQEVIRAGVYAIIWGGYVMFSEKVKRVFVKKSPKVMDNGMKAVIAAGVLIVIGLLSSVNFSNLTDAKLPIDDMQISDPKFNIPLSTTHYFDVTTNDFTQFKNPQEINEEATVGLRTSNGNWIIVLPEDMSADDMAPYEDANNDEMIIDSLGDFFSEDMNINISKSYIRMVNGSKYYIFEGVGDNDEKGINYAIALVVGEGNALTIYSYGINKFVSADLMEFIENTHTY